MFKLLIVSLFITTTMCYNYNKLIKHEMLDPDDQYVKDCYSRIPDQLHDCTMKVMTDWGLTPHTDPKSRESCCGSWQLADCIRANAEINCYEWEVEAVIKLQNKTITKQQTTNCFNYVYHSDICIKTFSI
ncbi:uncharacterized protein LOC128952502 [Oppia nitens]|uniref:uncharacterized protein LOC128952502 n=1 Tax=Oppia nitens TaxID=1686743 RepID=UPI0023DB8FB8|nr:uncharacterized protein LOC128952502 [Oppia nitens]